MPTRTFRIAATALFALLLALACGEESDDDGGDSCPGDAPGNASDCSDLGPGLACTYDNITCTCSGISWNCMQRGGNNTTGMPTGSGGNGFGPD